MKILLISAGTKAGGSTERAMEEAAKAITALGGEAEKFSLYATSMATCSGCGGCGASRWIPTDSSLAAHAFLHSDELDLTIDPEQVQ